MDNREITKFGQQLERFANVEALISERMQTILQSAKEALEGARIKYGILESDFDGFLNQYKPYFFKHGFITPQHFEEFFMWLCGCRCPDEPFGAIKIKESDFTLFHEYKELKLNPSGWNEYQEMERLENRINPESAEKAEPPKAAPDIQQMRAFAFAMKPYAEATPEQWENIIKLKTVGDNRPTWIGSRADAYRFAQKSNIKVSEFKKCFKMKNGRELKNCDEPRANYKENQIEKIFSETFAT